MKGLCAHDEKALRNKHFYYLFGLELHFLILCMYVFICVSLCMTCVELTVFLFMFLQTQCKFF